MINFNGTLVEKSNLDLNYNNRAFSYGDSLFDTSKLVAGKIQFLEDHYFRLMASMRMLRMQIPQNFTLDFFEEEILKTTKATNFIDTARVKFTIYRKNGGLYLPTTNKIDYLIEVAELKILQKENYEIDIFKEYYSYSGLLSTLKTNNRVLNVVASIFASENNLDNCILINENKSVVEVLNGNIFLIKGNKIVTPAITDGCIKGVIRKKVLQMLKQNGEFIIEETSISPFEIQKADSVFITNSIVGIQEVKKYRKKIFNSYLVDKIKTDFENFTKQQ